MTYIVVDLEATCSNDNSVPKAEMEMIEIGAVAVDRESLTNLSEFSEFVKPVRHPCLTSFCTELTTIRDEDLQNESMFPDVNQKFRSWINSFPAPVFCSWGAYDQNQYRQDCQFHNVEYPFDEQHFNLKKEFAATQGTKKMGMAGALRHVGLPLTGTHHRGIDDARNIAALLPYIFPQET